MAEHTKAHLWINTAIAGLAFFAAAGNTVFNWVYNTKAEALEFSDEFSYACRLEFVRIDIAGALGLCWTVTITNKSDVRTPIINHQAFDVLPRGMSYYSGFTEIEQEHGGPVSFPLILDNGEAKTYLVRVPISIPESVVKIIDSLPNPTPGKPLRMVDLKDAALKANIDIIGNEVEVAGPVGGQIVSWKRDFRTAVGQINFATGRGNLFHATLYYPPGTKP